MRSMLNAPQDMVVPPKTAYNILRPETADALFVLHQITGDPIYREWSWEIFQVSTCSINLFTLISETFSTQQASAV